MPLFQTENLTLDAHAEQGAILSFHVAGRSVNVFTRQVLADLDAALDVVAAQGSLRVLGIKSSKPSGFMAGADIQEFQNIRTAAEAEELSATGQRLFQKLAALTVPTVAAIGGPCLGGGLEFALACDYRLVFDQPKTQIGLPEIELGLLPAWGGTQRLPRVVGIERALQIIVGRKRLKAREALDWGLADAVASDAENYQAQMRPLFQRALELGKRHRSGLPLQTWRQRLLESTPVGTRLLFRAAQRRIQQQTPIDMPAPQEAFHAVRTGILAGMNAGFRYEREAAGRLALTSACRNLITLFFLMEGARKPEGAEAPDLASALRRVGVVGAGTMGAGIAQLAAIRGFEVNVQEINEAALQAGMKRIEDLFHKAAERGVLADHEARQKAAAIGQTTSWKGFADIDLVVEAALEDLDAKRALFREMARHTRPDSILATNTSSLSVTQLQAGVDHPERVAGLHFFNPVHKMPLVEVVRTPSTTDEVVGKLVAWASAVGKTPVVVRDSPGFIVNRILVPYLNEAGLLVVEGVPCRHVDHLMRRFGMPMGPLELLDQIGLDVAAHIARSMEPLFGNRLPRHPALDQMVQAGWLGVKSGRGFYVYRGKSKKVNEEMLKRLRGDEKMLTTTSASSPAELTDRMVLLMVNEAATCLKEGLADRADQVDLAMVLGTGWAPHRGGPLRYADDRGVPNIVAALTQLQQKHGVRFEPCAGLRDRLTSREPFYRPLP